MSFSAPPSPTRSRYFDSGCPTRCHYCSRRFEGSAIRDSEANRYQPRREMPFSLDIWTHASFRLLLNA